MKSWIDRDLLLSSLAANLLEMSNVDLLLRLKALDLKKKKKSPASHKWHTLCKYSSWQMKILQVWKNVKQVESEEKWKIIIA